MKVIHIESGLGNQMLSYVEYLASQKANPDDAHYIETMLYEIPECNDTICQWHGYELERIFGIKAPNIRQLFTEDAYKKVVEQVRGSRFWKRNWNYPVYITQALNDAGLDLVNMRGDFEKDYSVVLFDDPDVKITGQYLIRKAKRELRNTCIGYHMRRLRNMCFKEHYIRNMDRKDVLFLQTARSTFSGQRLSFMFAGNGIEALDQQIRSAFVFPPITDTANQKAMELIRSKNAVAIHARRGDRASELAPLYKYGYFKRAVRYIRRHVDAPAFFFFSDPGSIEWSKKNLGAYGLDDVRDEIYYIDWNKGEDSFRDMQLMAQCRHAIITNSSFGWWGAYLNTNPDKITCSPEVMINTTHSF